MQTSWDWTPYLVGGGTRPDAMNIDASFNAALTRMFSEAPENVRNTLRVTSAYRSPEVQERLWSEALAKYGDPEIADNWVARPGKSNHNHGSAVDLKFLDPSAQEWVHANAARYGLGFPMSHEPWHIEPINKEALSYGGPPAAPQNTMPAAGMDFPIGVPEPTGWQGILANLGGEILKPEEGSIWPQMIPRQAQAYVPEKRDALAPYLEFFNSL
ncbi:MAG: M15 family metallopeptidase [Paracoccaceae bacterium]